RRWSRLVQRCARRTPRDHRGNAPSRRSLADLRSRAGDRRPLTTPAGSPSIRRGEPRPPTQILQPAAAAYRTGGVVVPTLISAAAARRLLAVYEAGSQRSDT